MHRARSRSLYLTRHGRPLLLLPLLLALACNLERGGGEPQAQQTTRAAPQKGPAAPSSGLAELREDAPLSLKKLLGQPVAAVDAILGAPKGAVLRRASCVRFVPERVFFACDSVTQTYNDPTAQFRQIQVAFEDGLAARLTLDGLIAAGASSGDLFNPEDALAAVGLSLPAPPTISNPVPEVTLWSWFNSQARLNLEGRSYRVEISIVDEDRARSRLEVILNDPLTEAEQLRVLPPQGARLVGPTAAQPADP
ncbi:MAG: hypothetical protein IPK80_13405 [Nannocystis sp.]|nr:hypothetical protein [Nannocystis sp.]